MTRKLRFAAVFVSGLLLAGLTAQVPVLAAGGRQSGELQQREYIVIQSNADFTRERGVRSGSGTKADPYVISGWALDWAVVRNTTAWFTWRNTTVKEQLILNWNDDRVKLVDNYIGDLRVNQNVARTEDMTSGLFKNNRFGIVGQLRHFDGKFVHNVVGTKPAAGTPYPDVKIARFDGFNGAHFDDNVFYGYADFSLHGHHHGSSFGAHSHHHDGSMHDGKMDHTKRFHEMWATGNTVYSSGPWGLRYTDVDHVANDRSSQSEDEPLLNLPHVHHTRVHINDNRLFGAGLAVEVFNADDELHKEIGTGRVEFLRNRVTVGKNTPVQQGLTVHMVQGLSLDVKNNKFSRAGSDDWADSSGLRLYEFNKARVHVVGNDISGFDTGISAAGFNNSVFWWLKNNTVRGASDKLDHSDSVAHKPNEGP
jgi:hypothetical protein